MPEMTFVELRAEAARCLDTAKASNIPHMRRSLSKIAELYDGLAVWLQAEIAAGRLRESERP